jgi:hypothetical protein
MRSSPSFSFFFFTTPGGAFEPSGAGKLYR